MLLIPCASPPLLLAHRWLRPRAHNQPPILAEVMAHVVGWSILFEVIGPHLMLTTGDPWNAVAYTCGGTAAFFCWRSGRMRACEERADFDWLAPHYGWMEWLLTARKLERCRAALLQAIPPPRRALVAGQGRGAFVADLLRAHPRLRCTCVDSSAGMLQAACGPNIF